MSKALVESNIQSIMDKMERLSRKIPTVARFEPGNSDASRVLAVARYEAQVAAREAALRKYMPAIERARTKWVRLSDELRKYNR